MTINMINADNFKRAFFSGAYNLSNKKEYINELNVFPVPDGDTGTNMTLTIMAAVTEINNLKNPTMDQIASAVSSGSLRGARGNSGVILSQLFRGFSKEVKGKETLGAIELSEGFQHAVETAYHAVMKPKEGTILTVAKGMAHKAKDLITLNPEIDIIAFLEEVIEYGDKVLSNTPEMLPVLKEAGVVDSGGMGLMTFFKGVLAALKGLDITLDESGENESGNEKTIDNKMSVGSGNDNISTADIKYGYCTEFIILLEKPLMDQQVDELKDYLLSIGDSVVCVADDELVKIHVHTDHPGLAFERGLSLGQLTRMKVDNMREEHKERVVLASEVEEARKNEEKNSAAINEPNEKYGFIQVGAGEGIIEIFNELGTSFVISGGQTMNPSTEDILNAIEKVKADNIFIFPNNKNIILAAKQAASICTDKNIIVVPSKTIPEGISAMISFSEDMTPDENLEEMNNAMEQVKTGEVTFSIRDTSIDGKIIKKDDIMGISEDKIESVGSDVKEVAKELIKSLVDDESGLITLYYGDMIKEDEAEGLAKELEEIYSDVEVELHFGGQPLFYYLVSVE